MLFAKSIAAETKPQHLPQGLLDLTTSVHEGLENAPRLWGSDVRAQGPVKDWKTGLAEGGKVCSSAFLSFMGLVYASSHVTELRVWMYVPSGR